MHGHVEAAGRAVLDGHALRRRQARMARADARVREEEDARALLRRPSRLGRGARERSRPDGGREGGQPSGALQKPSPGRVRSSRTSVVHSSSSGLGLNSSIGIIGSAGPIRIRARGDLGAQGTHT